jgi:hypothetical protein
MPGNLPDRIDRAAIERIIQRATELQTGERDLTEGLSPDEVVALGREVGIPERYLKQAMLEEKGRLDRQPSPRLLDRVFGTAMVTAQRVVQGEPEALLNRLDAWMTSEELLTLQRKQPGRITWEPLRGMASALKRSSAAFSGKRSFMLARAQLVAATASGLEPGYSQVAVMADLRPVRGRVIGGAGAMVVGAAASAAALAVMSPFWWVAFAPLPLFLGIGWGISRHFRPIAARTLLGLERALDHLERGEVKPAHALPPRSAGLLGAVIDEVRRTMK